MAVVRGSTRPATPIVGIDLGTSNTLVAYVDRRGRARALPDEDGKKLIPSVVAKDPSGQILVGRAAAARRFIDPKNTVFGAKRLIGRAWIDPELAEAIKRLPYELRRGKNEAVRVLLGQELYTLPEISAFILRKARAVAEAALGVKVERAVITVPANFNELQREATKLAGKLADLEVVRVLNEPTAAALAYGYGKSKSEQVIVYDFGGGTFDVTLLSLSKSVFRVRATAGDMFLGGDDIDVAVATAMATALQKKHYFDARARGETFDALRASACLLKERLSAEETATVDLPSPQRGADGKPVTLPFTMTRAELARLIEPLLSRTLDVCKAALARVGASPRDVNGVVLVGGTTRLPMVRNRVAEFFGRAPAEGVDPDEVVAAGAAIQALALMDAPRKAPSKRPPPAEKGAEVTDDELIRQLMEISDRARAAPPSLPDLPFAHPALPAATPRRSRRWLWAALAATLAALVAALVFVITTRR